jgi:prepilin signal peptidase PulO-like enzyme (type II secretory pathway)
MSLLPLLGHLWQGRHVRPRSRLGEFRPLAVELVTALVCGWTTYRFGLAPVTGVLVFYFALFIHLAFVDLEHSRIPNLVVLPAIPMALALFPLSPLGQYWSLGQAWVSSLGGGGVGFGIMLLVYAASGGRVGAGDVKLATLLGVTLGFPHVMAGLILGFVVGGLAAFALLALRLKGRADTMPYGPALVSGATVILLGGTGISHWYFGLFH